MKLMINYKIEIFIPDEYVEKLMCELNKIGACGVGNYDYVASYTKVKGSWRPLEGASPFDGEIGKITYAEETKIEIMVLENIVRDTISVIKSVHPYEEPVYNVIQLRNHLFED